LHGYRRRGHNELDEPRFTQPSAYRAIDELPTVRALYAAAVAPGTETGQADRYAETIAAAAAAAAAHPVAEAGWFRGRWAGLHAGNEAEMTAFVDTGIAADRLLALGGRIGAPPRGRAPRCGGGRGGDRV